MAEYKAKLNELGEVKLALPEKESEDYVFIFDNFGHDQALNEK